MNRVCNKCHKEKSLDEFVKNKTCKSGYAQQCKSCSNAYKRWWATTPAGEIKRLQAKRRYNSSEKRKVNSRKLHLKKRYNLTVEELNEMKIQQSNKCLICELSDVELVIDHCHETGIIRGLLCRQCNSALGLFKENIKSLENAIQHVSKYLYF